MSVFRRRGERGAAAGASTVPAGTPVQREAAPVATPVPMPVPPRGEWRRLPVQRATFAAPALLTAPDAFSAGLGTWQNPLLLGELGHAVTPTAPAGLVSDVAEIAPPAVAPGAAAPTVSPDPAPAYVRPSPPEPRLTAARAADLDLPLRPLTPVRDAPPEPEPPPVQRSVAAPPAAPAPGPDLGDTPVRPLGPGAPLPTVPPVVQRLRSEGARPHGPATSASR